MASFVLLSVFVLCVFCSGMVQADNAPAPSPRSSSRPPFLAIPPVKPPASSPAQPPVNSHPISPAKPPAGSHQAPGLANTPEKSPVKAPVHAPAARPRAKTPAKSPETGPPVPPQATTPVMSPVSAPTTSPSGSIPSSSAAPAVFPSGRAPAIPAPANLEPETAQGPVSDDQSGSGLMHEIGVVFSGLLIIGFNLVF